MEVETKKTIGKVKVVAKTGGIILEEIPDQWINPVDSIKDHVKNNINKGDTVELSMMPGMKFNFVKKLEGKATVTPQSSNTFQPKQLNVNTYPEKVNQNSNLFVKAVYSANPDQIANEINKFKKQKDVRFTQPIVFKDQIVVFVHYTDDPNNVVVEETV